MRVPVVRCLLLVSALFIGHVADAQLRLGATANVGLGAQHPSYSPQSAPGVVAIGIGMETSLTWSLGARVAATRLGSFSSRDDVSICIAPEPQWSIPDNCFEPNYAARYWLLSADALLQPRWSGPFFALGGAGWTMVSSRAYSRFRDSDEQDLPGSSAIWRAGAGVTLGSSPRAPRLELVTTRFVRRIGTAWSITALQLWIR